MRTIKYFQVLAILTIILEVGSAPNPLIMDQFTADPSVREYNGKIYLYPSHDIPPVEEQERDNWFCMEDYHVFSSSNLTDWKDHGVILSQYDVPWVDSTSYSMWAPDCIKRDGKYYFYFPSIANDNYGNERRIGVAVANEPAGPFIPQAEPMEGVNGIDPNLFIDKDGQAYLYWSARKIFVAKLKDNMLELASEPKVIDNLPTEGLIEGPYMFERNGTYYLTYPHVEHETERLEYALGDSPMGPFQQAGVIMDEWANGCWTNHQSVIKYEGQWYLFYHHNDLSPDFDKNRSVRADSLFFNADGTIQKVEPTLRGIGLVSATDKIQIDRFSDISQEGADIAFLDSSNTFAGWKTILSKRQAWVKFNSVDFSTSEFNSVNIRATAETGSKIKLSIGAKETIFSKTIEIPANPNWNIIKADIPELKSGTHHIKISQSIEGNVEIDWISFE